VPELVGVLLDPTVVERDGVHVDLALCEHLSTSTDDERFRRRRPLVDGEHPHSLLLFRLGS
jgi:hypothetical protein